jgi:hypothetical protein
MREKRCNEVGFDLRCHGDSELGERIVNGSPARHVRVEQGQRNLSSHLGPADGPVDVGEQILFCDQDVGSV